MSAFVVGTDHIDYLVQAAICYGRGGYVSYGQRRVGLDIADEVGADLLRENILSVMYRYPDSAVDNLPGPIPTPRPDEYRYHEGGLPKLEPVQVLQAIACYGYQSCEHPGWEASEAYRFCEHLKAAAIRQLPGYDTVAWEVRRAPLGDREDAGGPLDDFNYTGSRYHY